MKKVRQAFEPSSGFSPLLALGPWGRPPLHGLGKCLRIAEIVLLPLRIGPNIFGRHQSGVTTKAIKLAAETVRANAGFHSDQAWRHIR